MWPTGKNGKEKNKRPKREMYLKAKQQQQEIGFK
jgi:hypothetical protein